MLERSLPQLTPTDGSSAALRIQAAFKKEKKKKSCLPIAMVMPIATQHNTKTLIVTQNSHRSLTQVGRLRPVRVVAQHTPRPGCGSPDRELDAPVRAASRRLSLAQERPRPATTMAVSVEEASSSVVREYLSRKVSWAHVC